MFVPVFFRAVGQGVGRDGSGLREGLREKGERGGGFFHGPSLKHFVFAWNGIFIPLGIL